MLFLITAIFVCPARSVLVERGPTSRRCVNAALSPLSCTTGSTWASWPCCHWCCTGSSSNGTPERRGGGAHTHTLKPTEDFSVAKLISFFSWSKLTAALQHSAKSSNLLCLWHWFRLFLLSHLLERDSDDKEIQSSVSVV